MVKPRIFINIHYLEIGGAETSLIGLLQALAPKRVDVDLFLNDHRGEMMTYSPNGVNVLPSYKAYMMIERPIKEVIKAGYIHIALARLWAKIRFWLYARKKHPIDGSAILGYVNRCVMPLLPSLKHFGKYDLAIAFLPPYGVVANKVQAKKKICWIHTDYKQIDVNKKVELAVWSKYDNVVSISSEVTRIFCEIFPNIRNRVIEIENILSPKFIKQRAEQIIFPSDMLKIEKGYTILTIGRYSYPKKLDEIPKICRYLVERKLKIRWYIIGYGGSDEYIRHAIHREGMENNVVLLGKRSNPYPYIKMCDWYIQPSRYEGKSVAVREAQMLGKPVIVTAYPTASSQVNNGVDGIIVPLPVKACADAIAAALTDYSLKKTIIEYLSVHDYGNESEVNKIYGLISC